MNSLQKKTLAIFIEKRSNKWLSIFLSLYKEKVIFPMILEVTQTPFRLEVMGRNQLKI